MLQRIPTLLTPLIAALGLGVAGAAQAQEAVDVGVIRQSDIQVVQKMLYPKSGRMETALALGWMPFDGFTTTPIATLGFTRHQSETLGFEGTVGGGWSLKNGTYRELESAAYGISPDAYGHIAHLLVDAQWSPIYAKMNWKGERIFHHDVYLLGGPGVAVERAMQPDHTLAISPMLGLGVGARIYMKSGNAIRVQLRDDVLVQTRTKTEDSHPRFIKQNVALTVGISRFGDKK
jgi:outer membrane beta-barrel protein